jgi:hypothetical protein
MIEQVDCVVTTRGKDNNYIDLISAPAEHWRRPVSELLTNEPLQYGDIVVLLHHRPTNTCAIFSPSVLRPRTILRGQTTRNG